jgi:hypothetical protein
VDPLAEFGNEFEVGSAGDDVAIVWALTAGGLAARLGKIDQNPTSWQALAVTDGIVTGITVAYDFDAIPVVAYKLATLNGDVRVRRLDAAQREIAVIDAETTTFTGVRLRLDRAGNGFVAWYDRNVERALLRRIRADGTLLATRDLGSVIVPPPGVVAGALSPDVRIASDGTAYAVWLATSGGIARIYGQAFR